MLSTLASFGADFLCRIVGPAQIKIADFGFCVQLTEEQRVKAPFARFVLTRATLSRNLPRPLSSLLEDPILPTGACPIALLT